MLFQGSRPTKHAHTAFTENMGVRCQFESPQINTIPQKEGRSIMPLSATGRFFGCRYAEKKLILWRVARLA